MVRRRSIGRRQGGFNLVMLVVMITVLQVVLAAALPKVSQQMQREKEAELIFRGIQYAEAIRVFQLRFGRLPVSLDELIEVEPRSIRQLWKDPMTESGEWSLLHATGPTTAGQGGGQSLIGQAVAAGQLGGGRDSDRADDGDDEDSEEDRGNRRRGRRRRGGLGEEPETIGPIVGVHSKSDEEAIRSFFGASKYNEWRFTADLLPTSAGPVGDGNVPRLHTRWLGRAFPEGIEPEEGEAPGIEDGGLPEAEDGGNRRRRRGPAEGNNRRPGRQRRGDGRGGG